MTFCRVCGKPLEDNEVCNCTAQAGAQQPVAQPPVPQQAAAPVQPVASEMPQAPVQQPPVQQVPPVVPQGQPPQGQAAPLQQGMPVGYPQGTPAAAGPNVNGMVSKAMDSVKGLFTKEPLSVVDKAAGSKGMEWLVFLIAAVVAYALMTGISWGRSLSWYSYMDGGSFGRGLLYGLLLQAARFFVMAGLGVGFLKILKKDVSFSQMCNVVGVAMIPAILTTSVGFVLNLMVVGYTYYFTEVGTLLGYILLVYGIVKLGGLDFKKHVWQILGFMTVYLWCMNIVSLIVSNVVSGMSSGGYDINSILNGIY